MCYYAAGLLVEYEYVNHIVLLLIITEVTIVIGTYADLHVADKIIEERIQ